MVAPRNLFANFYNIICECDSFWVQLHLYTMISGRPSKRFKIFKRARYFLSSFLNTFQKIFTTVFGECVQRVFDRKTSFWSFITENSKCRMSSTLHFFNRSQQLFCFCQTLCPRRCRSLTYNCGANCYEILIKKIYCSLRL